MSELAVHYLGQKPPHLLTMRLGSPASHELPGTLFYLAGLPDIPNQAQFNGNPFRPHRIGPHLVKAIRVAGAEVLVETDGGTIRLPLEMVSYSFST